MENIDISPDEFILLPPDEQMHVMKNIIKDWPREELEILKNMIDDREFKK